MPTPSDNHNFDLDYSEGDTWSYNDEFDTLEELLPVRDADANLTNYTPHNNARYVATDTGNVYDGDGTDWDDATRDFGELYEAGDRIATRDWSDTNLAADPHDNTAHSVDYAEDAHGNEAHVVTFAEDGDPQPPEDHELGGSAHTSSTLADINALVSDATLDDEDDERPPEAHDNDAHLETYAVDGDAQPPDDHDNAAHLDDFTYSSTHGDVDIQIDETDEVINFVTTS